MPTEQVRSTFEVMRAWLVAPVPGSDPWATGGNTAREGQAGPTPTRGVWSS